MNRALNSLKSSVKGPRSFADRYAGQANESQATNNIAEALKRLNDPKHAEVLASPEGQAFKAEVEAWAKEAEATLRKAINAKAAASAVRDIQSAYRWVEQYSKRKNAESQVAKYKQACIDSITKHSAALAFCDDKQREAVTAICSAVGASMPAGGDGSRAAPAATASAPAAASSQASARAAPAKPASKTTGSAPAAVRSVGSAGKAPSGPAGSFDPAAFAAAKKEVDSSARWLSSASNPQKINQYLERVAASLQTHNAVLEAEAVYLHSVRVIIAAAHEKLAQMAIKTATQAVESQKRWCTSHLKRGDQAKTLQSRQSLVDALETHRATLLMSEAGQTYLQEVAAFLSDLDEKFAMLQLTQEAKTIVQQVKSQLRWVNTFLKQKNTSKASRSWETCQQHAKPLLRDEAGDSKFAGLAEVDAIVAEYLEMRKRIDSEVNAILLEAELSGIERQVATASRWLATYLGHEDVRNCVKYKGQLKELKKKLKQYEGNDRAEGIRKKAKEEIKQAKEKLKPMREAQEVAAIKRPAEQTLRWLGDALDKKNEDKCLLLKENLQEPVRKLEQYDEQPDAKAFLAEAEALFVRLDKELGDIIEEKACGNVLRAAGSTYRWVENSLSRKDVRRTQVYLSQLRELLPTIRKFKKRSEAADFLAKAEGLEEKVDRELGQLLAEAEVEASTRKIAAPLRWFVTALDQRRTSDIVSRRQKLTEAALPLRSSRHATHPKAAAMLTSVDQALARCDKEMADILAEAAVRQVAGKLKSHASFARGAAKRGDTRAGLQHVQELHRAVQPLRSEYGSHAGARSVISEADALTEELGPLLGAIAVDEEVQKHISAVQTPLRAAEAAQERGAPTNAVSSLQDANSAAAPLRSRFAYRKDVQKQLTALDALNLRLLGGVPVERERAPCLAVDWKLPVAQQDLLKKMNTSFLAYDKRVNAVAKAIDALDLEGSSSPPGPGWVTRQEVDLGAAREALSTVKDRHLPALQEAAPENPAVGLVSGSLAELEGRIASLAAVVAPLYQYADAIYGAKSSFSSPYMKYLNHKSRAEQEGNDSEPDEWASGMDALVMAKAAFGKLDAACQLPEGYSASAAEEHKADVEDAAIEAETRFKEACVKLHKKAAADQNLYMMERYQKKLEERFPQAEENEMVRDLHERVSSVLAEEAAKREAERKEKQAAYEKKRDEAIAAQVATWVTPFSGAQCVTKEENSPVESWQYDAAKQTLKRSRNSKHSFAWVASMRNMELRAYPANAEVGLVSWYKEGDLHRMDLRSSYKKASYLWISYMYDASKKTFLPVNKSDPEWKLAGDKLTASSSGRFGCSVVDCAGIPPPLALYAAIAPEFLDQKIPQWLAKEKAKPGRCNDWVGSSKIQAILCSSCAFGSRKDDCAVCGRWMGSSKYPARLCSSCGFSSRADNCVKCNGWAPSGKVIAHLCSDCGFASRSDNCAKMK